MKPAYDVFISYSRKDQSFVQELASRLSSRGISVFYDEAELAVGDSLVESLNRAVQQAKYLLPIMSPDYFASRWGARELELALQEEIESGKTKVIPIMYRDCEVPRLLARKIWADFRTPEAAALALPKVEAAITGKALALLGPEKPAPQEKPVLGSIPHEAASPDLRAMIDELKAKVDAFVSQAPAPKVVAPSAETEIDERLCFIVMPFGSDNLNDVYECFVRPSIEARCDLHCERGDDVFGSNVVMDDIRHSIERSRLVIADLTGRNPNVFYEVGIAHTLNKDVLLLCQSMSDVPFDLRHRRVLVYDFTPKGCKKLEKSIVEHVNAMLNQGA